MPKHKTYKKIYKEDFPIHTTGEFKNCIDWKNIDNNIIRFDYENISGTFVAKWFDAKTNKLLVEYNGKEQWCHQSTINRSNICRIIGVINSNYRYNVGDIYQNDHSSLTIIERKMENNKKFYKILCNNCGFDARKDTYYKGNKIDYWVSETNLTTGITCPCCGKKRTFVQEGINDIPTTASWMVPYFQGGYDEAKKYMSGSIDRVNFICPECHRIKNKLMDINTLHRTKTISCIYCSDGISYPEKFVACFLEQMNEIFITQYSPEWANNKRYDFYLPNLNIIIEVDGGLNHGKKTFDNINDEFGKQVDELKDCLALEKENIVVFRIPADESNMEYLKNSITKTLHNIFEMRFIDWNKCERYAMKSLAIESCKCFQSGLSIDDISDKFHISIKTVKRYLDKGYKLGICKDYHIRKKVGDVVSFN